MASLSLSTYELRVLRAVDDRPGCVIHVFMQSTGYSEADMKLALNILEHDELVRPTRFSRTGATSWRITRAGASQLIATPPERLRRGKPRAQGQTPLFNTRSVA